MTYLKLYKWMKLKLTKINDMSQTLQMDEIDNVEWFTIRMKH